MSLAFPVGLQARDSNHLKHELGIWLGGSFPFPSTPYDEAEITASQGMRLSYPGGGARSKASRKAPPPFRSYDHVCRQQHETPK